MKIRLLSLFICVTMVMSLLFILPGSAETQSNLALGKPVTVSSVESPSLAGSYAVDGIATTRWSSAFTNNEWIYVDLGATYNINRVLLNWEVAYGSAYKLQVSENASTWTDIYSTTSGNGATDDITGLSVSGRYVRMLGITRATTYGYSLYEFEVYGTPVSSSAWYSNTDYTAATYTIGTDNTGIVTAEFDFTALANNIDGFIGYTDTSTTPTGYSSFNMMVGISPNGYFDVRNGSTWASDATVTYSANVTRHIKVVSTLSTGKYDVYVDGTKIANQYSYRTGSPALDDVGKVTLNATGSTDNYRITNHTVSSQSEIPPSGDWTYQTFSGQSGKLTVQFDATPSSFQNNIIGISQGAAGSEASLACAVQFGMDHKIRAYNSNGYTAVSDITYSAGDTYHIRFVINITNRTYAVYVTKPDGWYEITLGTDYGFRSGLAVSSLNTASIYSPGGLMTVTGFSGKVFEINQPVQFGTAEADTIMQNLQMFPANSQWYSDISSLPLLSNSAAIINSIGASKSLRWNNDMNWIIVPPDQARVNVTGYYYPDECDVGPFPIPDNAPVENWPMIDPYVDLSTYQTAGDGDRHVLVLDLNAMFLHEFWVTYRTGSSWTAASAATFNLRNNNMRPDGWTSADAAGLPILPAVVRYDEVASGMVNHAMRFTVSQSRKAYVYPATHYASSNTSPSLPRMGERLRLKQNVDISSYSPHAQAIMKGLKKYGMIVADNGLDWSISVAPDSRIQGLEDLKKLKGSDFEVVDTASLPIP